MLWDIPTSEEKSYVLLSQSYFISFYVQTIEKNELSCKSSHTNDNLRWMVANSRGKRGKRTNKKYTLLRTLRGVKGWVLYILLARHRGLSKWSVEELCQHECERVKVTRALNCTTTKSHHRANLSEWASDGLWWYHGSWTRNGDLILDKHSFIISGFTGVSRFDDSAAPFAFVLRALSRSEATSVSGLATETLSIIRNPSGSDLPTGCNRGTVKSALSFHCC